MDPKAPKSPTSAKADRQLAARYLAAGMSDSEVARSVGRNRKTIARWKRDPKFAARVTCQIDENLRRAQGILFGALQRSAKTLTRVLKDREHPAAAVRAATTILHKFGLLTPAAPPKDPDVIETVSLGGSLKVLTPAEAAKLTEGESVIVALPERNDPDLPGPRRDPAPDRPTA